MPAIGQWIDNPNTVQMDYQDQSAEIVNDILATHYDVIKEIKESSSKRPELTPHI